MVLEHSTERWHHEGDFMFYQRLPCTNEPPGSVQTSLRTHTLSHCFDTSLGCSAEQLSLIMSWSYHPQKPPSLLDGGSLESRRWRDRGLSLPCLSRTLEFWILLLTWLLYPRSFCVHLATREHFETNKVWAVCPGLLWTPLSLWRGWGGAFPRCTAPSSFQQWLTNGHQGWWMHSVKLSDLW